MHMRMEIYPRAAVERAMKLQEVLLRATAGKIKWWQAAEMIGISERLFPAFVRLGIRRSNDGEEGEDGGEEGKRDGSVATSLIHQGFSFDFHSQHYSQPANCLSFMGHKGSVLTQKSEAVQI